MTTLVTGATGLVGNNTVRELLDRGEQVRVLSRESSNKAPLETLDVELAVGDVRDSSAVTEACRRVDVVIHCAAYVHWGWSNAELHHSTNVTGTRNVCQAALEAGAKMVHVSTVDTLGIRDWRHLADECATEGNVPAPYVVSKRAAEAVVLEYVEHGLFAPIVNPTFMLGPWDWKPSSGRLLIAAGTRFTPVVPRGGNSFCDVRDVVRGILSAAEWGQSGRRYILGGDNLTYLQAWRLFAEVTSGYRPWMRMGPAIASVVGRAGDVWGRITGAEPDVNSAALTAASRPHWFTSARAEQELQYHHRPAREAAEAAWAWFRDRGYA